MASYCDFARKQDIENVHRKHHDSEHGTKPIDDDDLFRRLILEISQAGLSFETVLKKKESIYRAFPGVEKVSRYKQKKIDKLMKNPGIIRNKLKIEAAIYNAKKIKEIQKSGIGFYDWLIKNRQENKEGWIILFKKNFKFTGGEIVNELLMSINILPGAHDKKCLKYIEVD